jgi:hypothetical protein
MKKIFYVAVLAVLAGTFSATRAAAQITWTPAQQEVWNVEVKIGDLAQKGDVSDIDRYFDKDFQNWGQWSAVPVPRDTWISNVQYSVSLGNKIAHVSMVPVHIWVEGNDAYVDYYSTYFKEDKAGKTTPESGRNLDVLRKKNDQWLVVSSMTMYPLATQ